jgi:hypothetical protein
MRTIARRTGLVAAAIITVIFVIGYVGGHSASSYAAGKAWAIQDYRSGDIARPLSVTVLQQFCIEHAPDGSAQWVAGCEAGDNEMQGTP